jgi:hypothetical protein
MIKNEIGAERVLFLLLGRFNTHFITILGGGGFVAAKVYENGCHVVAARSISA